MRAGFTKGFSETDRRDITRTAIDAAFGNGALNAARARVFRLLAAVAADDVIGRVLISREELQRRIGELGAQVSRDYEGQDLLLLGILKGAVFFLSDLMRELEIPAEVDFMAVASYGSSTASSGVVRIRKDLDRPIEGRDVLVVEDIVDSGITLRYLLGNLTARNPGSLEVCTLLSNQGARVVEVPVRYVGFEIPNEFVIGYGLDYNERYRGLPYVATLVRS